MNRIIRVLLAMGVLSGGTGLALLFRLESAETAPTTSGDNLQVVPAQPDRSADTAQVAASRTVAPNESSDAVGRPPAISARPEPATDSDEQSEPPLKSAESYSSGRPSSAAAGRQDVTRGGPRPTATPQPARTHKIVDGDTLEEIARKYLGSASLAGAIFEANRAELSDPALLPLGVELTIPSVSRRTPRAPGSPVRQPLVPVAPGGRSSGRDRPAAVAPLNR
jgi:nucleoid-associated protein YgaU